MERALALALEARAAGDHPFGAVLEVDGAMVAEARNLVSTNHDITAHAETELVRVLEREGRLDLLARGTVHASCEPCPQCVGALFWAGARHVVFGMTAARLTEISTAPGEAPYGFTITATELGAATTSPVRIEGPVCQDEASAAHVGFWF